MSTLTLDIYWSIPNQWTWSQLVCFNENQITLSQQSNRSSSINWVYFFMFLYQLSIFLHVPLYQLSIFLHVPLSTEYISSCSTGRLSTLEQFYRETEFPWLNLESQIRAKKIPVSLPSSPIKMLCESVQGFLIYDKILKIYISPLKWRK